MTPMETVTATVNGQTYTLTLTSQTGAYEAAATSPIKSSYGQKDHYYDVTVKATDRAGNSSMVNSESVDFGDFLKLRVKERVKPVVSFVSPTTGSGLTNNKPTFKINITDENSGVDLSTFKIVIDAKTTVTADCCTKTQITDGYTMIYTPVDALEDGNHTITATISDNDGNVADTASISIKIDTVPPTLTISAPTDNTFTNNEACTVSGVTNDVTSSPVTVTIKVGEKDQGTVTVGENGAFSKAVILSEGENTITITAKDSLGKTTTVTRTVTLDTNPPEFLEVSVTPNPVDAGKTFTISVKVKS